MQQWVRFSAKVAAGILSAWFLLLPVTANALGLGNIKMDSALNEPLKAEIQLLSATKEDVKGLEVKLASREAFLRAGVDRSVLLSQIKFKIVKRGDHYYVILTTPQSVREPFLNFLVELNWKNGRMLREYTVLLDPADRMQKQRVAQAPETTPPVSAPVPAPAPMAAETQPAPETAFMPAPEAVTPAPPAPAEEAKMEQEPLYPAVPLDQAPQVPVEKEAEAPAPAPEPISPAPMAEAKPEAVPAPAPEPIAKAEAPAEMPAPAPAPEQPFEAQEGEGGLFPQIPLTAYKESEAQAPSPAGEEAPMPEPVGELDYGITKKGDNLWHIAEKLKPNNQVTVYQVMMALQQSNPKAFEGGNIHRLKVGQVMRIDDPSLLTAMSKAQALKQYEAQTTDWEGYLASTGAKVPRQAIVAGEQAPVPAESGVPSGELTLSTPQSEKMTSGTGSAAGTSGTTDVALLEQQARKAMQEAKIQRQKNAKLSARLNDLEAELKRMENLVNIKDSDLAELQRKLDELNAQQTAAGKPATTPSEASPKPEVTTPPAAVTPPPAEQPAPAEVAKSQPEEPIQPAEQAEQTPPTPPTPAAPEETKPVAPPTPPVAAPAPLPKPATAPAKGGGIMDMIKGFFGGVMGGLNAMMLVIGGVVILVILLLIFILVRRRKGVNFQESILTGSGTPTDSVSMDAAPSQGSSLMGGESSFLSDFAISGVSAIQAEDSEVDPLTEADVFMAYGRYEAAEERLLEAIAQDPERGELRVKLLELYNTTKNKTAFESTAEDYYAALSGNVAGNALWQKVLTMGRELVPNNPLFTGGVASGMPKAEAEPAVEAANVNDNQDVMDIGLDTGVFNTSDFNTDAFNGPAQEAEAAEDSGLDFNLDMGETGASGAEQAEEESGLDFSLDATPSDTATSDVAEGLDFNLESGSEASSSDLDFNLDTGDELTAETQAPETHDDLDFNLNLEGDEEPTATEIKLGMEEESAPDLNFDFAQEEPATESAGGMDMNLDASDASISLDTSGGGDEVGTKLDLARAYIDMGDPDGARSILDEVMEEGNDGQKQEAQQLIAQIG
jgi:pilus assembly protein FimV